MPSPITISERPTRDGSGEIRPAGGDGPVGAPSRDGRRPPRRPATGRATRPAPRRGLGPARSTRSASGRPARSAASRNACARSRQAVGVVVGAVDAPAVHPRGDQLVDAPGRVGAGPRVGEDLRPAGGHRQTVAHPRAGSLAAMTHRFSVTGPTTPARRVEKRGPEQALAREAAALALVAGRSWAPARRAPRAGAAGVLRACPARRARLATLGAGEARALGAVLRAVHDTRSAGAGGLWWWTGPAATLAGYRAGRVEDAEGALAGTGHEGLAARARRAARRGTARAAGGAEPFRLLHGDLVDGQHRLGRRHGRRWWTGSSAAWADPAEDLAYLVEVNAPAGRRRGGAPARATALPGDGRRVDAWRAARGRRRGRLVPGGGDAGPGGLAAGPRGGAGGPLSPTRARPRPRGRARSPCAGSRWCPRRSG